MGKTSTLRSSAADEPVRDPYKSRISPLRSLPSCNSPTWIMPDPAHTYAIVGWGKDLVGSSIMLLARMRMFGGGGLQKRLNEGFSRFKIWCTSAGKTTSLTEFSLKTFKVKTLLGLDGFGDSELYPLLYIHIMGRVNTEGEFKYIYRGYIIGSGMYILNPILI